MKKLVALGLLAMATAFGSVHAAVTKPVKLIVGAPVGSGPDVLTRKLSERMTAKLGVPVIIINRPGANGALALQEFNTETDRDHLIYLSDMQSAMIHPILSNQEKLIENVKHIAPLFKTDFVLAVSPKVQNFDQLAATIANGKTSYGSWGIGSPPHVMGEDLARSYKDNKAIHVPYKEYNQWFIDTSSQNLTYSFVTVGSSLALEQKGALKYLAITSPQRNPKFPNLPTISDLTKNQVEPYQAWASLSVHRDISPAAESAIRSAITEALASNELKPTFDMLNYITWTATPAELNAFITKDTNKYRAAYKRYNISVSN